MNARYEDRLNFREKIVSKKICRSKKCAYLCIRNHETTTLFQKQPQGDNEKNQKKFGGFEILNYLCTPFREHFGRAGMTGETEER